MTDMTYRLLGGPGSPYSLKLRAVLRYRRLPHVWIVPQGYLNQGGELAEAGKPTIPVLQYPEDGSYHADTTPLIYALEKRHPGARSLIPDDPADAFLAHLIEDFADEFLMNALFVYRWSAPEDLEFSPRRQLTGWLGAAPKAQFDAIVAKFQQRQIAQLPIRGGGPENRAMYARFYGEVLNAIEELLTQQRFLFGNRPSLAEIGLYGQLCQMAIDFTPSQIMKTTAPRAFQWVQDLDDASGWEGDWRQPDQPTPSALGRLLGIVTRYYMPYSLACAGAVAAGETSARCRIDSADYAFEVRPYTATCLLWLKAEFAALDTDARARVLAALADPGAEAWLSLSDAEAAVVPPHAPY